MGGFKKVYASAIFLLIVGGMAWGWMGMMGKNPVAQVLGKWAWIVYGLVGLAAIVVLARGRDAYLPFLGPTVFPCAALADHVPDNADTEVIIQVRPGAKVLYWGAEPGMEGMKELKSWREAYGEYQNTGVVTADENGTAVLRLRKPQAYKVPMKGRLESHVHYRLCEKAGWLSQVETHTLHSEPFVDMSQPSTQPTPSPPVIPVVANTPEMPVIADPVSGLPTAVPAAVVPSPQEKEAKKAVEGFSNEPVYSSPAAEGSSIPTLQNEDPRLQRLRSTVETGAIQINEEMGFVENAGFAGTDLDTAFQIPERPAHPPSSRYQSAF